MEGQLPLFRQDAIDDKPSPPQPASRQTSYCETVSFIRNFIDIMTVKLSVIFCSKAEFFVRNFVAGGFRVL